MWLISELHCICCFTTHTQYQYTVVFHKAALFSTSYTDTPTRVTVQCSWTSRNGTSTQTHSFSLKVKGDRLRAIRVTVQRESKYGISMFAKGSAADEDNQASNSDSEGNQGSPSD